VKDKEYTVTVTLEAATVVTEKAMVTTKIEGDETTGNTTEVTVKDLDASDNTVAVGKVTVQVKTITNGKQVKTVAVTDKAGSEVTVDNADKANGNYSFTAEADEEYTVTVTLEAAGGV